MKTQFKCTLLLALSALATALATPDVTITCEPSLPKANLVVNGNFDEGLKGWSLLPKGSDSASFSCEKLEGCVGDKCLTITGAPDEKRGVFQNITFNLPVKPGETIYVRMLTRKAECDIDAKNPGGIALHAFFADKTARYLPVFKLTQEDHEWTCHESVIHLKDTDAPLPSLKLYLCYYENEGSLSFDDIQMQYGTAKAMLELNADVKKVTVIHSVHGKLLQETVKEACRKELAIPAYGSISVVMEDAAGKRFYRHYPEGVDANVLASETVFPLGTTSRNFLPHDDITLKYDYDKVDATAVKKTFLCFRSRIENGMLGGHTHLCMVKVNGVQLGEKEIVLPCREFTSSRGTLYKVTGNSGYLVFYAPACAPIDLENSYCPATLESHDPFTFKLDITAHVKTGANSIEFINSCRPNPKYKPVLIIEQPRIVIE